jgi:hypothetical protein
MPHDQYTAFTKENLDQYLKELGKVFRQLNGTSTPAEIILIGGASIIENYQFRDATADVDALIHASSAMKEAVTSVGRKFGLPDRWLNSDFTRTGSYSPKLNEIAVYYRTFSNILTVRTVTAEYLAAMKLRSDRTYKHDSSDILGILYEQEKTRKPLSKDKIQKAFIFLYGDLDQMPQTSKDFLDSIFLTADYEARYHEQEEIEKHSKELLENFEHSYPNALNEKTVNEILASLKKK